MYRVDEGGEKWRKSKEHKNATVHCSICGMDMDCPESMLTVERHFCARCTDLMAEGYEPEELKMSPDDIAQHLPGCDEVSMLLMELHWSSVKPTIHP